MNPFASGGGLDYYSQPGFGYLSVRQVGALIGGLLTVHSIGLLYLMGSALVFSLLEGAARPEWLPWGFRPGAKPELVLAAV